MRDFLDQLFHTGQVTVPVPGTNFDLSQSLGEQIRLFDRSARANLAGEAPPLEMEAAVWAATLLAGAARLAIARDLGAAEVQKVFAKPCPKPRSPSVDYSADLFLRYVPDLLGWVTRLASGDPLVEHLRRLAEQWPLSSVGIHGLKIGSLDSFIGHPSLRQLYIDRILQRGDASRLSEPRVAAGIRTALGAHPELSPALAEAARPVAS